jgi:hypothetical protein
LVLRSAGQLLEEAGVHEAFCDSLLSRKGLLALEAANVGKSRLGGLRDSLVCPNGRVVHILASALSAAIAVVERIVDIAVSYGASAAAE